MMDEKHMITYWSHLLSGLDAYAQRAEREVSALLTHAQDLTPEIRHPLQAAMEASANEGGLDKHFPPLTSVLHQVRLKDHKPGNNEVYFHEPGAINKLRENVFPKKEITPNKAEWLKKPPIDTAKYKEAWDAFEADFAHLGKEKDLQSSSYSLYYLLFKHLARIPSKESKLAYDVSLFDRNRAKAAIGICNSFEELDVEYPYLLLKGDLSGIQDFIYSDVDMGEAGNTKRLAKKLRGRSFYVSLLTDFIASCYVEKLALQEANIIYTGGGHFLMVAPNREETRKAVAQLQEDINLFLMDHVEARTHFLMGQVSCKADFMEKPSPYIRLVSADLSNQKKRKHEAYLDKVFVVKENFIIGERKASKFKDDEKLGKKLPYASNSYMLEISCNAALEIADKDFEPDASFSFGDIHRYFFLIEREKEKQVDRLIHDHLKTYESQIKEVRIIALNHTNFLEHADFIQRFFGDIPIGFGFRFVGSYAPVKNRDVMDFGELEKLNDAEKEIIEEAGKLLPELERTFDSQEVTTLTYPYLAVMRMDIDNLSSIFSFGLKEDQSLARVATMSREFYLFFSGYVNELARDYKIYVTYSGGDDAFVVGSWLNVIHFARAFRNAFKEFVCFNEELTFSAGIFLCDSHYPIAKFANEAAIREEEAKEYIFWGKKKKVNKETGKEEWEDEPLKEKNAISVFDHVLGWDQFESMHDFGIKLLAYTKWGAEKNNEKMLSRALAHRILRLIKGSIRKDGSLNTFKLYQNSAYLYNLFARHAFTEKVVYGSDEDGGDAKKKIDKLTKAIANDIVKVFLENFQEDNTRNEIIRNYLIPTHYVTLKTRTI